jgi:hypothetical protein
MLKILKKYHIIYLLIGLVIGMILAESINIISFFKTLFAPDLTINSFDNKYGYIQLSSPQKKLCHLNIYKLDKTDVDYIKLAFSMQEYFRDPDMIDISWGLNSYDLFFCSSDVGDFCFIYEEDTWKGPMNIIPEKDTDGIIRYYLYYEQYKFSGIRKYKEFLNLETLPIPYRKMNQDFINGKRSRYTDYFR